MGVCRFHGTSPTRNYPALYEQFKREKQYLQNVSPTTMNAYGWAWKAFDPIMKCGSLAKADVVSQIGALRKKGLTAVSINTYVRSLNAFFTWLQPEGHGERMRIPRLKEARKTIEAFSDSQVRKLVEFRPATRGECRIHVLSCLILDTGVRVDEALSMQRSDVDLDNLLARIRQGKGSKERVVPISMKARKVLFRHMRQDTPNYGDLLFLLVLEKRSFNGTHFEF